MAGENNLLCSIATPLADEKLTKKVLKVVKKAAKQKYIRRGVKEVVKALRKDKKGLCVISGDISPIDVISHIPAFCEEKDVPYVYVPSKRALGEAGGTKRPTSCVLIEITGAFDSQDKYDEVLKKVKALA